MNWQESVMHLDDIDEGRMPDSYGALRNALKKQAEISFKAGIKEVVEWIEENKEDLPTFSVIDPIGDEPEIRIPEPPMVGIMFKTWQAQLEKWGI